MYTEDTEITTLTYAGWRKVLDIEMQHAYGLSSDEAIGIDEEYIASFFQEDWTPAELVEWIGNKFDLTHMGY